MASAKQSVDKYANVMIGRVDESAANTLTFQELPQVTTLLEKKAYLVNRVAYTFDDTIVEADADAVYYGLSLSNRWTTPTIQEPTIVDFNISRAVASGAPATLLLNEMPKITDFSTLPGGGLLLPTRPLYLWVMGANLASAQAVVIRLYFTVVELQQADYWDLVESLQAFS